ncbi:uncharacterized protein V1518DRAFT_412960 [Limtongia smithiae]|uniref:uncharacterized protein n=1 Tax=Limtongia smithiae TaxID=1125753 RepID=UPI0034CDFB5C
MDTGILTANSRIVASLDDIISSNTANRYGQDDIDNFTSAVAPNAEQLSVWKLNIEAIMLLLEGLYEYAEDDDKILYDRVTLSIVGYCTYLLEYSSTKPDYDFITKITLALPFVRHRILRNCEGLLLAQSVTMRTVISGHDTLIHPQACAVIEQLEMPVRRSDKPQNYNESLAIRILEFLEVFFRQQNITSPDQSLSLAIAIIPFTLVSDKRVAGAAHKAIMATEALQAFIDHMPMPVLLKYLSTYYEVHELEALYFLTAVLECPTFTRSSRMQQLMEEGFYWTHLASSLLNGSLERKKLSLYIFQKSRELITRDIYIPDVMSYPISAVEQLEEHWQRYFTVLQFIAVDSSIHQTKDGLREIARSLNLPSVYIPAYWQVVLIKLGLSASLPSIRVEMAKFVANFPQLQGLSVDYSVITDAYLPFVEQASFFVPSDIANKPSQQECKHGEYYISKFLFKAIDQFMDPAGFVAELLGALVKQSATKRHFEAFIIYVLSGVLHGALRKKFKIGDEILDNLRLFCLSSEFESKKLRQCALGYYFRILSHAVTTCEAECLYTIYDDLTAIRKEISSMSYVETLFGATRNHKGDCFGHYVVNKIIEVRSKPDYVARISVENQDPNFNDLEGDLERITWMMPLFTQIYGPSRLESLVEHIFYDASIEKRLAICAAIASSGPTERKFISLGSIEKFILTARAQAIQFLEAGNVEEACASYPYPVPIEVDDQHLHDKLCRLYMFNFSQALRLPSDDRLLRCLTMLRWMTGDGMTNVDNEAIGLSDTSFVDDLGVVLAGFLKAKYDNIHNFRQNISWGSHVCKCVFAILKKRCEYQLQHARNSILQEYASVLSTIQGLVFAAREPELVQYCDFIKLVITGATSEELRELRVFELLKSMFDHIIERGLPLSGESAGIVTISLLFKYEVMKSATATRGNSTAIIEIGHKLVTMSYARRLILPLLAKCLYIFCRNACCEDKAKTSKYPFPESIPASLAPLLVEVYTLQQITENVFVIDEAVLGFASREDGVVVDIEDLPDELFSKAYIALILGDGTTRYLQNFHPNFGHAMVKAIMYQRDSRTPNIFESLSNDAAAELHRVALSELMLLVENYIPAGEHLPMLLSIVQVLNVEFSPFVRTAFEWLLVRLLYRLKFTDFKVYIVKRLEDTEDKPRFLASLLTASAMLCQTIATPFSKELSPQMSKNPEIDLNDYIQSLLPIMIAYSTTNRAVLRHTATSLLVGLRQVLTEPTVPFEIAETISQMVGQVEKSPTFGTFKYGQDVMWNGLQDYRLASICGGVATRVNDRSILRRRALTDELFTRALEWAKTEFTVISRPVRCGTIRDWDPRAPAPDGMAMGEDEEDEDGATTNDGEQPLQTKSNTRAPAPRAERTTKGRMIVLATLVDKVPNLGGICRVADALGAELLCIPDISVTRNREFKTVAVTADKWMPMKEVKEADMVTYIRECREKGYSIWGMEQTDKSVVLTNDLVFPEKVVLIVGREKEGISASLLKELDRAVEIKQVGVVRSMNVQTATAVIVHAYAVQHC